MRDLNETGRFVREVAGDLREQQPQPRNGEPAQVAPEHKGTWGRPKMQKDGTVFVPENSILKG